MFLFNWKSKSTLQTHTILKRRELKENDIDFDDSKRERERERVGNETGGNWNACLTNRLLVDDSMSADLQNLMILS